jgi:hypothetical protein
MYDKLHISLIHDLMFTDLNVNIRLREEVPVGDNPDK